MFIYEHTLIYTYRGTHIQILLNYNKNDMQIYIGKDTKENDTKLKIGE